MNFQFYLEKLHESKDFDDFKKEYSDAYFCGGFFIIDKAGEDNKQHLDYYIPSKHKIFSFELERGIQVVPIEMIDKRIPEKIKDNYDFDFDDIEEIILVGMEKNGVEDKLQKILLSLQTLEGGIY